MIHGMKYLYTKIGMSHFNINQVKTFNHVKVYVRYIFQWHILVSVRDASLNVTRRTSIYKQTLLTMLTYIL
jgi:hypothetical protein